MTDPKTEDPADVDQAGSAKKIEEAGVADESAAYTDAIAQSDAPAGSDEAEAHPS